MTFHDEYGTWRSLPSADVVHGWLKQQAGLKAEIRVLQLEISIQEATISRLKPRDKGVRLIGLAQDDAQEEPIVLQIRRQLAATQAALDAVEVELEMFTFTRDIFKALAFKERA
jgi:hypothetical protein